MKIVSWRSVVGVVLGLAVCAGHGAAGGGLERAVGADTGTMAVVPDPDEFLARSITRIALMDLRARPDPIGRDFRIAAHVLGMAQGIAPDDPSIVRRRLEAAWAAGDHALFMDLTRRTVELDPSDTVAQLRLISDRVKRFQTVEDRIAVYERLLGGRGASLDPSVRSRLALDLALLLRERGRESDFVDRLIESAQLDPTNKDAAALVWAYFGAGLSNPADRFELLTHLLYADPLDPNIHLQMATILAQNGVFDQAKRFHNLGARLLAMGGRGNEDSLIVAALVLDWYTTGPENVVKVLNQQLDIMRHAAIREIMHAHEAQMPIDELTHPDDVRLGMAYDRVRLAAARAAGDEETVNAASIDLRRSLEAIARQVLDPANLPQGADMQRVEQELMSLVMSSLAMLAWAGVADEHIVAQAKAVEAHFGDENPEANVFLALVMLAQGDAEAALDRLTALPAQRDPGVLSGIANALEALGRTEEAVEVYRFIAGAAPLSIVGAWAKAQVDRLGGISPYEPRIHASLTRASASIPDWIDRMGREPRAFMSARAEVTTREIGALERANVRIVIQNTSPIPLGVGGDRAINSKVALAPRLNIGPRTIHDESNPEFFELDRRFRLLPGESMVVDLWPDPGYAGWIAESRATQTVRINWRMIQGFMINRAGLLEPGILCLTATTERQTRPPIVEARLPFDELALMVDEAPRSRLHEVAGAVRARILGGETIGEGLALAQVRDLAERFAERYERSTPRERMMLLAVLPNAAMDPGMRPFDDATLGEEDPRTLMLVLATRAADPDHSAFDRADAHGDPALRELAGLVRERLRAGGATYARCGPGGRDLAPRGLLSGFGR